jgi:protocatechuate 3,4-dioxygenase beta subunit
VRWLFAAALVSTALLALGPAPVPGAACRATPPDSLGPFYKPGAPVRTKVGTGYVLTGRVVAARTCRPIARARIEVWLVNRRGEYDDAHRATFFSSRFGGYRFESNKPPGYDGRPAHIHVRVTARGFRTLVAQHYPRRSAGRGLFNLILTR